MTENWKKLNNYWDRLRWAREQWFIKNYGKPGNPNAAAKIAKIPRPTYAQYERDPSGPTRAARLDEYYARIFGKSFGVNWNWLLTGWGSPYDDDRTKDNIKIPHCGYVFAGRNNTIQIDQDVSQANEHFEIQLKPEYICLTVRGDSMLPVYKENTTIIFGEITPPEYLKNQEAFVKIDTDEYLIKTIARGSEQGKFNLWSYKHPPIENVKILEARPLIGTWLLN